MRSEGTGGSDGTREKERKPVRKGKGNWKFQCWGHVGAHAIKQPLFGPCHPPISFWAHSYGFAKGNSASLASSFLVTSLVFYPNLHSCYMEGTPNKRSKNARGNQLQNLQQFALIDHQNSTHCCRCCRWLPSRFSIWYRMLDIWYLSVCRCAW